MTEIKSLEFLWSALESSFLIEVIFGNTRTIQKENAMHKAATERLHLAGGSHDIRLKNPQQDRKGNASQCH